jgi:hypothetical protein
MKASDRDRTKSGHGRSSDSTGTEEQSPRKPQHEEDCGREALFVRLSSHCEGRSYCTVIRIQEEERCRQEEGKLQNFGQQQSDGQQREWTDRVSHGGESWSQGHGIGRPVCAIGSEYTAIPRSSVKYARRRGLPLKVEVLPQLVMLNMAIRGESDKQEYVETEILSSAVTITTPSGPLCMFGV